MAHISISGTLCKGNDKYEAIVARTINGQNGQQTMVTFKVAVYQGKDKDGKAKYGYWKITAFGVLADNIYQELKAGDRVTVTGQPKVETWQGQNGENYTQPAVVAQAVGREINPFPPRNGYGQNAVEQGVQQMKQAYRTVQPQQPQNDEDFPLDFSAMDNPQDSGVDIPF